MAEFLITLEIMLPILLMLALGWFIRRIGLITQQTASAVNKLIFRLFLPVLLFNNIRGLDTFTAPGLAFEAFMLLSILAVFLAAYLLVPRFVKDSRKQGVMVQGIFRTNFAILGIPLAEAMFGQAGTIAVTLALPVVIIANNVLAVVALSAPSGSKATPLSLLKSIATNPLIIACVLGCCCLFAGVSLPAALDKVCTDIGSITSPLSLIVLGASLCWKGVKDNRRLLAWTVLIKQAILPVVMVGLGILLGFRQAELGVILILFAAPCAVSSYPMAESMGGDGPLAASQVVLTTVFSMGTLFVMIYLCKLLGVL